MTRDPSTNRGIDARRDAGPCGDPGSGPTGPTAPLPLRERDLVQSGPHQPGEGIKTGGLTTIALISVTLTDSADGQIARITVDSMALKPTGEVAKQITPDAARAVADSLRGAYVWAYTVRGAVRGSPVASNPHPALAAVFQVMGVLFPGLRTGIKVGDSWADTTNINNDARTGHQTGRVIANWRVSGVEDGGMVLEGSALTTVTTNATNGQVLRVLGHSQEHLVTAARGPTRAATIETVNDVTMTSPQNAAPMPARSTGSLKLTREP